MTIFIDNVEMTDKDATGFISKPGDHVKQIAKAWCQSNTGHHFENKKSFKKAVQKNQKTLRSLDAIETLFTSRNYLFSTKTKGRKETLYFEDRPTKQGGRLRQEHPSGPLAKIDKKAKSHRFVSKERYKFLKAKRNRRQLPRFYPYEQRVRDGKYHLEFACGRKKVIRHLSEGTIKTNKKNLDRRIYSALKNILGICGRSKSGAARLTIQSQNGRRARPFSGGVSVR